VEEQDRAWKDICMSKTWFITGASRGFGKEFARAALKRGDSVAATARDTESLDDLVAEFGERLLPIPLDVTDRQADFAAVAQAHKRFGGLDIVINNAGYGQFGAVEELSESEIRQQIETNVFGAFWITQAALPFLRAQGSGHILQISSIGGVAAFPNIGAYHASKWALEGFSEALAQEVAGFGISVTIIEPGGFETDWAGDSAKHATPIEAYEKVRNANRRRQAGAKRGNPVTAATALLEVIDSPEPPLRVLFGSAPTQTVKDIYAKRLDTWEKWEKVSHLAQGD
jgi:NAD(P)-dependent dehydrogenase (short-subunit alcohol dehydrogenase family)